MSELKLPIIKPGTPAMIVNASGEGWSSWGNVFIWAVSVQTGQCGESVGADTQALGPPVRPATAIADCSVCRGSTRLIVPQQGLKG